MDPDSRGAQSSVTKFRRDYFVAAILPLLCFFGLVITLGTIARDHLEDLLADSTHELNTDAEQSLQALGESIIRAEARHVAEQLSDYFRAHPDASIAEMRADPHFLELAIQKVGETGYTAVSEAADSYLILVHPNPGLVDRDMREFAARMPSWWAIVEKGITGNEASGYYDWLEPDGSTRQKFLVTTPAEVPVAGVTMMVSATTYIDEFSEPVAAMRTRAEAIIEQYQQYVAKQWWLFSLAFGGVVLSTLTGTYLLGTRATRRFIDPIGRLADAVRDIGEGRWDASRLEPVGSRADEIGTLARTLQRMSSQIAELFDRLKQRVGELDAAQTALHESEDHLRALYEEAKRNEAIYRSLIRSSADAIVMTDLDLRVTYLSPTFVRLFGWSENEVVGQLIPYVPETELERTTKILTDVARYGRSCQGYQTRRSTKSGELIDVSISASRFDDHEGRPMGVLAILRDISESKRIEAQMQRMDRLEAIGTLAGGVAHDFNNLLTVVQGNVSVLKSSLSPTDESYECLLDIESQIRSGASLTNQLLGYARKGRYALRVANLNEVVTKSTEAIRRSRKDVVFRYELAPDLLPVEADFHQIEQVLLNLALNACDAMPDGGDLTIRTENGKGPAGPVVVLSVVDTGTGMDSATLERVFDPFFTTKEQGRGTGLGLASAFGIVESHGGTIEVSSEPGHGSTFTVWLPASEKSVAQSGGAAETISTGHGTVLIVDDEEPVLRVSEKLIRGLGYDVLTATSGQQAIEIFEAESERIDLVLLDMILPGLSGSAIFERLRAIDPEANVLLCSGYSLDSKAAELLARGGRGHIQKPYTLGELAEKLRAAMAARERGAV